MRSLAISLVLLACALPATGAGASEASTSQSVALERAVWRLDRAAQQWSEGCGTVERGEQLLGALSNLERRAARAGLDETDTTRGKLAAVRARLRSANDESTPSCGTTRHDVRGNQPSEGESPVVRTAKCTSRSPACWMVLSVSASVT